jgi:hypothetical protein
MESGGSYLSGAFLQQESMTAVTTATPDLGFLPKEMQPPLTGRPVLLDSYLDCNPAHPALPFSVLSCWGQLWTPAILGSGYSVTVTGILWHSKVTAANDIVVLKKTKLEILVCSPHNK